MQIAQQTKGAIQGFAVVPQPPRHIKGINPPRHKTKNAPTQMNGTNVEMTVVVVLVGTSGDGGGADTQLSV